MALKVQIHLEGDLDSGLADETTFSTLDGRNYDINFYTTNIETQRDAL